jgi:hypothetical protein
LMPQKRLCWQQPTAILCLSNAVTSIRYNNAETIQGK